MLGRGVHEAGKSSAANLAVEIYYYGAAEPIAIPLPVDDQDSAQAYFEQLKADVIEAQRHSRRQLSIDPSGSSPDAFDVEPARIQRMVLAQASPPAGNAGTG